MVRPSREPSTASSAMACSRSTSRTAVTASLVAANAAAGVDSDRVTRNVIRAMSGRARTSAVPRTATPQGRSMLAMP